VSIDRLMELDRQGEITWVSEPVRDWARRYAASSVPPSAAQETPGPAPSPPLERAIVTGLIRKEWKRFFSPVGLGLVLILFALPFLEVSCAGQKMLTVSGYDFLTGLGAPGGQHIGPQILVILPLLLALAGIGLSFSKVPAQRLWIAIACGVAAGCLVAFVARVVSNVRDTATPLVPISVTFGVGLIGSVLCFLAVAGANLVLFAQESKAAGASRSTSEAREKSGRPPPHPPPLPG
jgi:hypothetical protein